ncbi:unnamed protein product [Caenorhabditis auriculariae]|uniref:Uncharacterized protein n=1 Tax=Caenorhabditis auriculariae TaxID=2777116 RepID=A0A8S1HUM1_9PELO|nr:unnamed protein product [Caenorhabditis auriculariae]
MYNRNQIPMEGSDSFKNRRTTSNCSLFNPYTAALRYESQRPVFAPTYHCKSDSEVSSDSKTVNKYVRSAESQEVLDHIPSVRTVSGTSISLSNSDYSYYPSSQTLQPSNSSYAYTNGFIVPQMVQPEYRNSRFSDYSTPYASLPQYQPLDGIRRRERTDRIPCRSDSQVSQNTATVNQIRKLPDPFEGETSVEYPAAVRAPNNKTLNKYLRTADSLAAINAIDMNFDDSEGFQQCSEHPCRRTKSTQTLNKYIYSPDSLYEIEQLPEPAARSTSSGINHNKLRDFSIDSLEDLRQLPSVSQVSLFDHPTRDVHTARNISPQVRKPGNYMEQQPYFYYHHQNYYAEPQYQEQPGFQSRKFNAPNNPYSLQ